MYEETTVTIVAYDGKGNEIDRFVKTSRGAPEIYLLEFLTNVRALYPTAIRFEMVVQF